MIGIYKITNKINNKVYIGQSCNIEQRWKEHRSRPYQIKAEQYDSYFYKSVRKYGLDNFNFEVLEECTLEELNDKEIKWIQFYNSTDNSKGYNLQPGGHSSIPLKISQEIANQIIEILQTTELTQNEIAIKFNVSQRLVSGINLGEVWVQNNLIYPIRSTIQNKTKPVCKLCGKPVYQEGNLCVDCFNIQQRKVSRPNRDELKQLIRTQSFTKIGKQYGVSDNAIRKWCDYYKLPRKVTDIKKYTNEEWELL